MVGVGVAVVLGALGQIPTPQAAPPAAALGRAAIYSVEYRPGFRLRLPWERTARAVYRPAGELVSRVEVPVSVAVPQVVAPPAGLPPLPVKASPQAAGADSTERVLVLLQSLERRLEAIERREVDWSASAPPAPRAGR